MADILDGAHHLLDPRADPRVPTTILPLLLNPQICLLLLPYADARRLVIC